MTGYLPRWMGSTTKLWSKPTASIEAASSWMLLSGSVVRTLPSQASKFLRGTSMGSSCCNVCFMVFSFVG